MASKTGVPAGFRTVSPHLVIQGAAEAIEFYKQAFGATVSGCMQCPSTGKIMHAEIQIGDSMINLADEFPDYGSLSPKTIGGSPVVIHLYLPDVDATFQQAIDAGATVTMPLMDMFWGDRYGKLDDPFGHHWSLATHLEDLTEEQMKERMSAFMVPASV